MDAIIIAGTAVSSAHAADAIASKLAGQQTVLYMYNLSIPNAGMLAIRLPEEIEHRLARLAQRTGRSNSFYARQAIVEHLDEIEARAASEAPIEAPDDPFGAFSEWGSAADRRAYGDL